MAGLSNVKLLEMDSNGLDCTESMMLWQGLAHCSSLQHLVLSENRLRHHAVRAMSVLFARCECLTNINLRGNSVGDCGATSIASALMHNHTLRVLNVSANNIYYDGASALARLIRSANSLHCLDLTHNHIQTPGVDLLLSAWLYAPPGHFKIMLHGNPGFPRRCPRA